MSVYDHGFLYGDGVFEGIRAYNGRVFKLKEHLERLYEGAQHIMLQIPLSMEEMATATLETMRRNGLKDAYIRIVVSRGLVIWALTRAMLTRQRGDNYRQNFAFPQEHYVQGMDVIIASTRQRSSEGMEPRVKSLNYLNNIIAKLKPPRPG